MAAEPGEEPSAGSKAAEGVAKLAAGAAGGVDGRAGDSEGVGLGLGGRQQLFLVGRGGERALPGERYRIHSISSNELCSASCSRHCGTNEDAERLGL